MNKRNLSLQWDSTLECNLCCTHCYHNNEGNSSHIQSKDLMSLDNVEAMLDNLEEVAKNWRLHPKIQISGGEPLKRKDLYDILNITLKKKDRNKLAF